MPRRRGCFTGAFPLFPKKKPRRQRPVPCISSLVLPATRTLLRASNEGFASPPCRALASKTSFSLPSLVFPPTRSCPPRCAALSRSFSPNALHTHRPWATAAVQEGISSNGAFRANRSLRCPPSFPTARCRYPPLATLLLHAPAPTRSASCARSLTQW